MAAHSCCASRTPTSSARRRKRSQAILDSMAWLGLDYDEGPVYQIAADGSLSPKWSPRCSPPAPPITATRRRTSSTRFAPRSSRAAKSRATTGAGARSPARRCPRLRPASRRSFAFAIPLGGVVDWQDAVKGRIEIGNDELDDLIIARSDGAPTYNFCVVVDDLDMRITHVIRGDDHVNNTPRQINMIRALGGAEPVYAHLPTVLTPEGDKLSKRHGARGRAAVPRRRLSARGDGQLPGASGLGAWRRGDLFARRVHRLVRPRASFLCAGRDSIPTSCQWLNHEHIKRLPDAELGAAAAPVSRTCRARRRSWPAIRRASPRCFATGLRRSLKWLMPRTTSMRTRRMR